MAKLHLKVGLVEIDYEGPEEFLTNEVPKLLTAVAEIHEHSGLKKSNHVSLDRQATTTQESLPSEAQDFDTHITTIARKMNVKNTTDIVRAGGIYLTFVEKKIPFSRQDVLSVIKEANGYYKKSDGTNCQRSIDHLVKKGIFIKKHTDKYTISSAFENEGKQYVQE